MKCAVFMTLFLLATSAFANKETTTQSVYGKYKSKSDIFTNAQKDCFNKMKRDLKNVRSSLSVEVLAVLPEAKSYLALCELRRIKTGNVAKLIRK
jgi:hypothetical protein